MDRKQHDNPKNYKERIMRRHVYFEIPQLLSDRNWKPNRNFPMILCRSFKEFPYRLEEFQVPTAVAFSDGASSVVAAAQHGYGSCLYIKKHPFCKPPFPEFKWLQTEADETKAFVTLAGTTASYDTTGGSPFIVSCSKSSDISLWHGKTGRILGSTGVPVRDSEGATLHYEHLDISPDGKILAASQCSTLQWLCAESGKFWGLKIVQITKAQVT
ncbi:hypothetical protein MKW92_004182 [Papaver armeniacum]|nr:hypothetical protein MKW92_004182 [Papaver armeniacum]